jgi:hypothetical protein
VPAQDDAVAAMKNRDTQYHCAVGNYAKITALKTSGRAQSSTQSISIMWSGKPPAADKFCCRSVCHFAAGSKSSRQKWQVQEK